MKAIFKRLLFFTFLMLSFYFAWSFPNQGWPVYNSLLKGHWQMQSSAKVSVADNRIATVSFNPQDWYKAYVPGTVLGSLTKDAVYKNIFYHRNLEKISSEPFQAPWWFRTSFSLGKVNPGQVTRLLFNGINYRADIWLNGKRIASADSIRGGFCRFLLDVSQYVHSGENILALKVAPPDTGDLTVGFVDWNPEPPDHNMGIWRDVRLIVSGPVSIDQPFIQTKVDTATLDHADLTVSALLRNHTDRSITGILKGTIGNNIYISQKVILSPNSTKEIVFSPEQYHELSMDHPKLWWVHTWGKPNLYDLHLQFEENNVVSDTLRLRFGIRTVSDYVTSDGHRGFRLNGKKILIKGGGWTDPMLLDPSPDYIKAGIDYAVHLNLNAIRMEGFWGESQEIYNLCDEKGILIMAGFSCQWEWSHLIGTKEEDKHSAIVTPEQNNVAAESWQDQILWLRNHPSIFLWLYGSDKWPRPSLEKRYLAILKKYDPTRPSVASAKEWTSKITGPTGVKMRGPYDYVPPDYWYVDTSYGGAFGFNTETSPGPEIPVLESLRKMIPADSLWPVGSAWLYHAARGNFHNLRRYNEAMDQRLGKPDNLNDYLRKAQFLNYEGMRAMYEAFEANRFKSTGIIQWMYNASWPKLWWQLYDYYLMPTGAFYGAKKANEPLHISYNYGKNAVDIINNTDHHSFSLSARIILLDFNLKKVLEKEVSLAEISGRGTAQIFSLPVGLPLSETYFLDLKLSNQHHQVISTNFYVLSTQKDLLDESKSTWYVTPESQFADLKMLEKLPPANLDITKSFYEKGENTFARIKLKNPSSHLAFMVHLDLKKSKANESVAPVFWEDNYITLLPGEERIITGYCHTKDLHGEKPAVTVDGWNVED